MPPPPVSQPEAISRSDARRNRELVVETAIGLLSERPEASMSEIADASGLGRTTLYRHFDNRDALIAAIFERLLAEAREFGDRLVASDPPLRDMLTELVRDAVNIGERYRFLQRHRDLREQMVAGSAEHPDAEMVAYLERARARGELRADLTVEWVTALLTSTLITMVDELDAGRLPAKRGAEIVAATLHGAFCA